jgi:hypothetical protein
MTTSRCPRSRSTRRDPLPHALRFVRHRPWFFRFGVPSANCMASWSSSVGYPSVISSCLPSPLLFVVLVRSGCWCVREYYENIIRISVAIATESGHDLVRGLGRSVEGAASGRGSMAGNRACPSAPSPRRAHATRWRRRGPTARGASVEDLQIRAVCWLQAEPP